MGGVSKQWELAMSSEQTVGVQSGLSAMTVLLITLY